MQAGDRVDDAAIRAVFDQLGTAAPTVVLPWDSPVEEVLGTLEAADALSSMRLHASLLAHRLGVPAVGLAYDPKVIGALRRARARAPLPAAVGAAGADRRTRRRRAGARRRASSPRSPIACTCSRRRASEALDLLAEQLDGAPPIRLPEDGRDWLVAFGGAAAGAVTG